MFGGIDNFLAVKDVLNRLVFRAVSDAEVDWKCLFSEAGNSRQKALQRRTKQANKQSVRIARAIWQPVFRTGRAACLQTMYCQNWQGSLFTDDVLSELAGQPVYRRCTVRTGRAACLQTIYCQNWQDSLFTDDVLSELAGQAVYRRCTVRTGRAGCLQTMYCQNRQGSLFTDDLLSD